MHYKLVDRVPVKIDRLDMNVWADKNRRIAATTIKRKPLNKGGKMLAKVNFKRTETIRVSTVFLVIDHNHYGGEPVLFETMIFGGEHDEYQMRYKHYNDSVKGHNVAVELALLKLNGAKAYR